MTFASSGISGPLHLGGLYNARLWLYRTTDALTTVDNTDYFALVAAPASGNNRNWQVADMVVVQVVNSLSAPTSCDTFMCSVVAIDADGNATVSAALPSTGYPYTYEIALAASATTDGMDITITAKDAAGATIADVFGFDWWISEAATGIGLTAESYSGTVTASVGAILTAFTAKKHFAAQTAATGIFTATAVASANPTDQYVVVQLPSGDLVVSAASGTSWEGV